MANKWLYPVPDDLDLDPGDEVDIGDFEDGYRPTNTNTGRRVYFTDETDFFRVGGPNGRILVYGDLNKGDLKKVLYNRCGVVMSGTHVVPVPATPAIVYKVETTKESKLEKQVAKLQKEVTKLNHRIIELNEECVVLNTGLMQTDRKLQKANKALEKATHNHQVELKNALGIERPLEIRRRTL